MQHRCHYCGKILYELPYTCRRCGYRFCSDHHLPENHHCHGHHSHGHKFHHRHCRNCGRELTGLPYKCNRCGGVFCENCRLPENHGCVMIPSNPTPVKPKLVPQYRKLFKENANLRNFTILSILFILVGFFFTYFLPNNYHAIFQSILEIGVLFFIFAYFLYALKCWGATNKICAVLMITIPLFSYFLSTSKIPDSTTNAIFYLALQFCFYAIISVILLYISDKVKMGIERIVFKRTGKSTWYFTPELSYSVIGVLVVSCMAVNYGGSALFFDNTASITQSLQSTYSPTYSTSYPVTSPTIENLYNTQIVPTIQPEVVKNIERTVVNSPQAIDITTLEMRIHVLINQQRRNNGLSSLSYDGSLASIARKHSADMARNNYFSHINIQGFDPTERGNQLGYSCYKNYGAYYTNGIAENIFQTQYSTTYNGITVNEVEPLETIAQSTVDGWMKSPGHRQNILTSTYDREGIGVAISSDKKVYVTEDFC